MSQAPGLNLGKWMWSVLSARPFLSCKQNRGEQVTLLSQQSLLSLSTVPVRRRGFLPVLRQGLALNQSFSNGMKGKAVPSSSSPGGFSGSWVGGLFQTQPNTFSFIPPLPRPSPPPSHADADLSLPLDFRISTPSSSVENYLRNRICNN